MFFCDFLYSVLRFDAILGLDFSGLALSRPQVNGPDAHPVYKWLKSQKGSKLGDQLKWNFVKFLVDKEV